MSDDSELRATSDLMLAMIDRLSVLERRKRNLPAGTREFATLAWEVADAARMAVRWSELQLQQANEALARGGDGRVPLDEVPKRRLDEVLADWRQAEMRLSQATPGSAEADAAAVEATRLRLEYRELQDQKHAARA